MSVIRVNKNKNYTTISNVALRDRNLSFRAKGLLCQMLSLPEDWDYSIKGLAAISKEGEKAVRTVLAELEAAGYLVRTKVRGDSGRFTSIVYDIFEEPQTNVEKPEENQEVLPCAQKGQVEKGQVEKRQVERDIQLNKELLNKELLSKDVCKKESSAASSYNEIIQSYDLDPNLQQALIEYIKMRKYINAPLTDYALRTLINKLLTLTSNPEELLTIVNNAIHTNSKTFYPLAQAKENNRRCNYKRETSRDKQYAELDNMIQSSAARALEPKRNNIIVS